jgi:hypothetical protein
MSDTTLTAPAAPGRITIRFALGVDAVLSGANGVAYLALAGPLGDLFGLPADTLRILGALFVVYAGVLALMMRRPGSIGVAAVIAGNTLWVIASLAAAIAGWQDPTTAGTVWIVLQALLVAGFAELQVASAPWRAGTTS